MQRESNLNDKHQKVYVLCNKFNFIRLTAFQNNHKWLLPYVAYSEVNSDDWI